jgi:uncharacterized protein YraI
VRSGPGTDYPVVGTLKQGEVCEITGRNPAGDWWQFNYGGQMTWVSSQVVEANSQARDTRTVIPCRRPRKMDAIHMNSA